MYLEKMENLIKTIKLAAKLREDSYSDKTPEPVGKKKFYYQQFYKISLREAVKQAIKQTGLKEDWVLPIHLLLSNSWNDILNWCNAFETQELKSINSVHDMPGIEIIDPTEEQRNKIKSIIMNNWTESKEYKLRTEAGAFLQCDSEDYILIEFWLKNFQPFIDFVNQQPEFKKGV